MVSIADKGRTIPEGKVGQCNWIIRDAGDGDVDMNEGYIFFSKANANCFVPRFVTGDDRRLPVCLCWTVGVGNDAILDRVTGGFADLKRDLEGVKVLGWREWHAAGLGVEEKSVAGEVRSTDCDVKVGAGVGGSAREANLWSAGNIVKDGGVLADKFLGFGRNEGLEEEMYPVCLCRFLAIAVLVACFDLGSTSSYNLLELLSITSLTNLSQSSPCGAFLSSGFPDELVCL